MLACLRRSAIYWPQGKNAGKIEYKRWRQSRGVIIIVQVIKRKMLARFIGEESPMTLINGKVYETISIEDGWYRIVDESGEDYLYPPDAFEIVLE